jgi:hypothetical protein
MTCLVLLHFTKLSLASQMCVKHPIFNSSAFKKLVYYPTRCCGFSRKMRKTNIIKTSHKMKENNMIMQSLNRFCSYGKVGYKYQLNRICG